MIVEEDEHVMKIWKRDVHRRVHPELVDVFREIFIYVKHSEMGEVFMDENFSRCQDREKICVRFQLANNLLQV